MDEFSARQPAAGFGALLRRMRAEARLTQEELAEAAGLSTRSISDLERGVSHTARKETARLLADALAIAGPARTAFVAAALGKAPASEALAAKRAQPSGASVAAADSGGAVACIWLLCVTTVAVSETTPATMGVTAGARGTANGVQPRQAGAWWQTAVPPPAGQASMASRPAIHFALHQAAAAALNNNIAARGASEDARPRDTGAW